MVGRLVVHSPHHSKVQGSNPATAGTEKMTKKFIFRIFVFNVFISFHNATISSISQIKNFNMHVRIDHFHFKHETRIKEKLLN